MANRKSASKQAAGGGAPRSPTPQPAVNKNPAGKASSKPRASSNQPLASKAQTRPAPKPTNPQAANRSSSRTNGTVKSAIDCSPKSSGSQHLSNHSSTADHGGLLTHSLPIATQKQQLVPSAQDVRTEKLSSIKSTPHSQAVENKSSSPKQGKAAVPTMSLGRVLNQVSSFFGLTAAAPSASPIHKRVRATNVPMQAPTSSKGDVKSSKYHPVPTSSSTSSGHKGPQLSTKEVVLSAEHVKKGPHDAYDRLGKSNTSANVRISYTTKAIKSTSVLRSKETEVPSSSSKVLSRTLKKTTTLCKRLLRQYSPIIIWRASDSPKAVSAYSTLTAAPLPSPPKNELQNKLARKTIAQNPELFSIVAPINVDAFDKKLKDHPNQPFVKSVIRGLRGGFWPLANTSDPTLPTTYDGSHQRQPITTEDKANFIRCDTFGNRGSGWNWDSFASLVNGIGTEKKDIPDLLGYADDNFAWEFEGNTKYYKSTKKHLPAKQTLLQLWDELGIPHDENKQLSGPFLPIIGYGVDANNMTVKVPDEKMAKVIQLPRNYTHEGTFYTLNELQSVAKSTNAVHGLYSHLPSGLRGLSDEMVGKERPSTKPTVANCVARSLSKLGRMFSLYRFGRRNKTCADSGRG